MESRVISGYHVHIYYREEDGPAAAKPLRDDVADHGDHALWLGQTLAIDFEAVRDFMETRRRREAGTEPG